MPRVVANEQALSDLADRVRATGRIGFDTEFMRERTYRARLCLVQVSLDTEVVVIDPEADPELGPIADVIADPKVEVVVHAGKQDFEIMYERYERVPQRAFDVQVAAAFVGYGSSLAYGRLVQDVCGKSLHKGESYTEWCRRPLSDAQVRYAMDDVRYLLPMADALTAELRRRGRLEWALEEMATLEDEESYRFRPEDAWRRVSGRNALSPRQTAVLAELAAWREETAARRDLPRGWVIKDVTLVEVARKQPSTVAALKGIRGLSAGEAERSAKTILAAVERARNRDPIEAMPSAPRSVRDRARAVSGLADALVRARSHAADIATELVATRAELEALLADVAQGTLDERRHRLLQGWRRDLAGDAVLALAEGRVGVRATDRPPYVEQIGL